MRWKGSVNARRDFAATGIAVEVKTTAHTTRLHHFGSISQLEPQDASERVFLLSIGIRHDVSAQKHLPDFFSEIETALVNRDGSPDDEAIQNFRMKLAQVGYEGRHEAFYRQMPGFAPPHLIPTLYSETHLDRLA